MSENIAVTDCPLCGTQGNFAFTGRDFMFDGDMPFHYARCPTCQIDYQTPQPSLEDIAGFYPDSYDKHTVISSPKPLSGRRKIVLKAWYGYKNLDVNPLFWLLAPVLGLYKYKNTVPYVENGLVLDVGCGNGQFLQSLEQIGWQVKGVDFNENAVNSCQQAGLDVRVGTIEESGFPENSFDLVSARHVIEHVPDPKGFVVSLANATKPGGKILIRTPNNLALGKKYFGVHWFPNEMPRHLMLFTPNTIDKLLTEQGFVRCQLKTLASPRFVLKSLDIKRENKGKSFRKNPLYRLLGQFYALVARLMGQGDEIYALYQKKA
jgi:2-polyprenyl-3-methyl-5-hydroxy-6-metoxy-1,4-benzoquinol methylase